MVKRDRLLALIRHKMFKGGVGSLAIKLAHTLLVFAVAVTLARLMGPDGYGIYAFALAIVTLAALPAQAGLPQLIVRETARAHAEEDWARMRGLWQWANRLVMVLSVLLAAAVGVAISIQEPTDRTSVLAIATLLVPVLALAHIRAASLRGLRHVIYGQLPESVIRPLTLLILVGIAWLILPLEALSDPVLIMTLYVSAASVAFVAGAAMLLQLRPPQMKFTPPRTDMWRVWLRSVIPLSLIAGFQIINNQADIVMLGVLRSDEEVGIYRASFQISLLVIFGLQAINQLVQPWFARLYQIGDMVKLQRLVTASARVIVILATLPFLAILGFGDLLLKLVFGDPFRSGALALAILAGGQAFNAAMGSVVQLLNMTGHETDTLKGVVLAALLNLLLNVALIPRFGMEGAAIATFCSLVVWNLYLRHCVSRRLQIESSIFGRWRR
ncbi:flippase [Parvibaculum sp.]|uniref:flippase n=1 Tax=Parvibaculum sp. TaxID=2024848 RepID=UPI003918C274